MIFPGTMHSMYIAGWGAGNLRGHFSILPTTPPIAKSDLKAHIPSAIQSCLLVYLDQDCLGLTVSYQWMRDGNEIILQFCFHDFHQKECSVNPSTYRVLKHIC